MPIDARLSLTGGIVVIGADGGRDIITINVNVSRRSFGQMTVVIIDVEKL